MELWDNSVFIFTYFLQLGSEYSNGIQSYNYFAFSQTSLEKVRVVILGDSPSPSCISLGYAFGTAFKPSRSLLTICECIEREYKGVTLEPTGQLDGWIERGNRVHGLIDLVLIHRPDMY